MNYRKADAEARRQAEIFDDEADAHHYCQGRRLLLRVLRRSRPVLFGIGVVRHRGEIPSWSLTCYAGTWGSMVELWRPSRMKSSASGGRMSRYRWVYSGYTEGQEMIIRRLGEAFGISSLDSRVHVQWLGFTRR